MTLGELARRCGGILQQADADTVVQGFTTDSREDQAGRVFLAIKGARVDGHEFVSQVLSAGAVAAIVEKQSDKASVLVCELASALASFGQSLRDEFTGPVIGVTGSNGKTTCKEYTAAALSPMGGVLKSPGNRNTEYTSPLVWFERKPADKSAVIEMAMRGLGQIRHLASVSKPSIGVVTCIGTAHVEMVGSRAGVAQAKGELLGSLPNSGVAIIWNEDDFREDLRRLAPCPVMTFGYGPGSDCRVLGYRAKNWTSSTALVELEGKQFSINLPAIGRFQALNAAAALLAAVTAGSSPAQAAEAMQTASLPPLRMEVREHNGYLVLVDTYNASPDSAVAALRALMEGPSSGRRIAILGEMRELGDFTESGHRLVGQAVAESNPDYLLLTGGPTRYIFEEALRAGFPRSRMVSMEDFELGAVREFVKQVRVGDVLLIKGSRALALESVLEDA